MKRSSKNRLMPRHRDLFPDATLFHRIARAVCRAGVLPRKELYEAWETARRVRRRFRGGWVVDLACGHGLLAQIMLILDQTSPLALAVDTHIPKSAGTLLAAMSETWPFLGERLCFESRDLGEIDLLPGDVVVSAHACGGLTDMILARAVGARARVAVLPCCHDLETCDTAGLGSWMAPDLAVDAVRAIRLKGAGYEIYTAAIPAVITPKNRLLMGAPASSARRVRWQSASCGRGKTMTKESYSKSALNAMHRASKQALEKAANSN
jgi:hypothetical protein